MVLERGHTALLDIFENPYGAPRPTEPQNLDNPSTSYSIGKPTKCKNTPQNTKHETPRNTPSNSPWNTQKIRNSYFWGIFLVFSGYFFDPLPSGEFVCRAGIFGLFWGLWGFLLCSWLVGCQPKPAKRNSLPQLGTVDEPVLRRRAFRENRRQRCRVWGAKVYRPPPPLKIPR